MKLTKSEQELIVQQIKAGKASLVREDDHKDRRVYEVKNQYRLLKVVYDHKDDAIVTVLPEALTMNLGELLKDIRL